MVRRIYMLGLACAAVLMGCSEKGGTTEVPRTRLIAPSEVAAERTGKDEVTVTWKDRNLSEKGFAVYASETDVHDASSLVAEASAGAESCVISGGLAEGSTYYIAVQAKADDAVYDSKTTSVKYLHEVWIDEADRPTLAISSAVGGSACVSLAYSLANVPADAECGVCWSSSGTPDVDDLHQQAAPRSDASRAFQVIPNVLLEYGRTWSFRAYAKVDGKVWYSDVATASLEDEPEEVKLSWARRDVPGLPSDIEVYETESMLNGRNFRAWYAIADISKGNVEFRTMVPSSAKTIASQAEAEEGCLVLVNGGYFYNGRNTGLSVVKGSVAGTISSVRGSLKTGSEEYDQMYYVTRGVFGVGEDSRPDVFWAGMDGGGNAVYYDRPLPSVVGEDKYGMTSSVNPSEPVSWTPEYALSAGPVLLKDGKCPFDFTLTDKGNYMTNYEVIAYDIFGADVSPDRTAVGCTADGRVVLFICDGRITGSKGATLTELAAVLKGIGCTDAVNFDGGGSTGMWLSGQGMINHMDGSWRSVVSTMGFFSR